MWETSQPIGESPLPREPGHFWSWTPSWHSYKHLNHKADTVYFLKIRNAAFPPKTISFLLPYLTQQKIPEKFNWGIKCNLCLMAYIQHDLPWPLKSHFKGRTHSLQCKKRALEDRVAPSVLRQDDGSCECSYIRKTELQTGNFRQIL